MSTTVIEGTGITVKQAVDRAIAAATEYYSGQNIVDITLEEVEKSEDSQYWLITLGFYLPSNKPKTGLSSAFKQVYGDEYEKRYKLFEVDARTGHVDAMKIRAV